MHDWITILISVIALGFSVAAYFRGRNIDLQNQVYLKKLEAYSDVIGEFFKLLKILGDVRDEAEELITGDKAFMNIVKLNELGDKIDFEIDQIHKEIGLRSIYFSEELIAEIMNYLDTLYGEIDMKNSENPIEDINSIIDFQTQELEKLITKMRNEIGLNEMNRKLLKRVEKGDFKNLI
ncbi:hypothetical protein [Mariniradius sediminis]|uniref:Uncharacterized protein n=1 Tax=Mariniradius sediminis TaxID=2909237 RepID=A0ABS9C0I4_9BACT|nr:hypothetical protein [Mariniradius sediminis]MCF1753177.1 hypothetical protein [Mariniradius sediminis]